MSDDNYEPQDDRPSKSQLKRDMTALQKLGEILVSLPEAQLAKIPMDSQLAGAVYEARALKSREGIRRQLQYIGRLMREIDAKPIEAALEKIQSKHLQSNAKFHQIERWRDKLIAEGDKQLEEFIKLFPATDSQQLRQLIRNAQRKKSGDTELFRFLRGVMDED